MVQICEVINILRFELEDWKIFKKIFENTFKIVDEIVVKCDSDGLNFTGIDRGHICFFEGNISKELFDEYEIDGILLLCIDLNEFINVLKRGKSKDKLVFECNEEVYHIKFKNKNNRTFTITQVDDLLDSKSPPSLDYSVEFECDFDSIKNSVEDASLYSNKLTFVCKEDSLNLSCEGTSGTYINECVLENTVDGVYSASYSVVWLLNIFNTKLGSSNLLIHMGDDFPMLIEMSVENCKMSYLLAPIMGED